jgi:hypothetical protein
MAHPDLDARLHLLQHNREGIMVILAKSVASGLAVHDLVAVVADTTDSVGGPMARAMAERGEVSTPMPRLPERVREAKSRRSSRASPLSSASLSSRTLTPA